MKFKRGKISPYSLFAMFFVCRVLVVFTVCNVTSLGNYSSDMLISLGLGLILTLLISIPAVYASNQKRDLLQPKWISILYGIYFLYLGAVTIGRFSFFASMELNENTQSLFLASFIILACIYAAWLGIEPISRFGSFILAVTVIGVISVVGFSSREFSILNLFPFTKNSTSNIFVNALSFACETSEIILLMVLAPKVNGKIAKPFYSSIVLSFVACGLLFFFSLGVLGDTASVASFPFYELSQISKFDESERLDSVYTAFWIFAVFLKSTLFLYCAADCFKFKSRGKGIVLSGIGIFAVTWIIAELNFFLRVQNWAVIIPFLAFGLIIPVLRLIFRKKSKGELLLEQF